MNLTTTNSQKQGLNPTTTINQPTIAENGEPVTDSSLYLVRDDLTIIPSNYPNYPQLSPTLLLTVPPLDNNPSRNLPGELENFTLSRNLPSSDMRARGLESSCNNGTSMIEHEWGADERTDLIGLR